MDFVAKIAAAQVSVHVFHLQLLSLKSLEHEFHPRHSLLAGLLEMVEPGFVAAQRVLRVRPPFVPAPFRAGSKGDLLEESGHQDMIGAGYGLELGHGSAR